MKKTLKKALAMLLSIMMIVGVMSAGMLISADSEYTMIAIVAMKPQEGDDLLATRHIFNITESEITALNGGTPVSLSDYGFEADWGIAANSDVYGDYHGGNWDRSSWGYDPNGHLYLETYFPLAGGTTPAEEYAAAARGEVKGIIRETGGNPDGIIHDALDRAYVPDLKANEVFEGTDTVRLVLTTEEEYYAPKNATKNIVLSNCDSLDSWWVWPGDTAYIDNDIKSEGTGSIRYPHTGGVAWGAALDGLDLTGLKSISFDIAADNAGILTDPTDKCVLLMSDGVAAGWNEPFNGDSAFLKNPDTVKKIMQFDVSVLTNNEGGKYTLTGDSRTFMTVTLTPSVIGEEFNYKNVTGFMHWSCSNYGGNHTEWMDNLVATVEVEDEEEREYVDFKTWSADQFNAAVSGSTENPGDALTTDAKDVYSVYSRPTTYGTRASGMVGYASYGNSFYAEEGHEYTYEFDFWVNSIDEGDENETLFYGDLYNHESVDDATVNTYFTGDLTYADFAAESTVSYNEQFGYKYKTISRSLVAEESGESEPRWYYNRLNVRNQGDRESYPVGDVSFYECRIYDLDKNPFEPIVTLKPGEDQMAGFSNEANPNMANPKEMDVLALSKCAVVTIPKAADCQDTLLFGNAGANLKKGNYVVNYKIFNVTGPEDANLFSIRIRKGIYDVKEVTVNASEIDLGAEEQIVSIPFTVEEDGDYAAYLSIDNKMGFCISEISLGVEIDSEKIAEVVEKINAIGEVKYDPDVNEDNGEVITAARTAYDALCQEYNGMDMSAFVENFAVLTLAETTYQGKVGEYNDMIDAAALIDEAISAIPSPVTVESEEYIVAAENAIDSFIETYSLEKAQLHIKTLPDLRKAREDFDKLAKEEIIYGDVDGDKSVTANDALEALQASIGARQLDERATKAADVDKDEKVTANDALCILQFTVGARTVLPVE